MFIMNRNDVRALGRILVFALVFEGCAGSPAPTATDLSLRISTDSASYQLQTAGALFYFVRVNATIQNIGTGTVYLSRWCGDSNLPESQPIRPRADLTPVVLTLGDACLIPTTNPSRISLAPGASYSAALTLQSRTRPAETTIAHATGAFELAFDIRSLSAVDGIPSSQGLLPIEKRTSPSFVVRAP